MKRFADAHRVAHERGRLIDHGRLYSTVRMNYIRTQVERFFFSFAEKTHPGSVL
jgi:hypothetical protein